MICERDKCATQSVCNVMPKLTAATPMYKYIQNISFYNTPALLTKCPSVPSLFIFGSVRVAKRTHCKMVVNASTTSETSDHAVWHDKESGGKYNFLHLQKLTWQWKIPIFIGNASSNVWFSIVMLVFGEVSGQTNILPKPELRAFWGDSLTKPPFGVTNQRFGRYNLTKYNDFLGCPTLVNKKRLTWPINCTRE